MRNPEQRCDISMAARLDREAASSIAKNDGQLGSGRSRRHVSRVLFVPRSVGQDELAFRSGEVAIGNVNRDALLAFGAKAVGQQREIDFPAPPRRLELIFV